MLDLGCGTGRVALHLARRGHRVVGVDRDPELRRGLQRAAPRGCRPSRVAADARELRPRRSSSAWSSRRCSSCSCSAARRSGAAACAASPRHLRPGGRRRSRDRRGACPSRRRRPPPLPDVREVDGWVYSSLPLEAAIDGERSSLRRLRQTVSPGRRAERGARRDPARALSPPTSSRREAAERGPATRVERRAIAPTDDHVGSTVVLLERRRDGAARCSPSTRSR